MRQFNKFEKSLIKKLVLSNQDKSNIADFIVELILKNKNRMIAFPNNELLLYYNKDTDNKNEFITELIEAISLIKYLDKNNLVFIHSSNRKYNGNTLLPQPTNIKYDENGVFIYENGKKRILDYIKIDTTIYNLFKEYISSFITPGTELNEYVKNGFISTEQKKHNQILFWTRAAFAAALVPSFIGLFDNYNNLKKQYIIKSEFREEIHQTLLDINNSINNKSFPKKIKAEITNDLIQVIIKNKKTSNNLIYPLKQ